MTEKKSPAKSSRQEKSLPPDSVLCETLNTDRLVVEWLAGDGSDRCYYRIIDQNSFQSFVLMVLGEQDQKQLQDPNSHYDWISIGTNLRQAGLFVPQLIAKLTDYGCLVIQDYGDNTLERQINAFLDQGKLEQVDRLYESCCDMLAQMLMIAPKPEHSWCQRQFDQEKLAWELRFFMQEYGRPVGQLDQDPKIQNTFIDEANSLAGEMAKHSKLFVHRDFHSRNLMVQGDQVALLDFQDARLGPPAYDFVSLIFDSYVGLEPKHRMRLLTLGLDVIRQKVGPSVAHNIEITWKMVLLQRTLKAIGSFGYLTISKKRGDYLKYVAPSLLLLEEARVEDDRWPLLSQEIPATLKKVLDK